MKKSLKIILIIASIVLVIVLIILGFINSLKSDRQIVEQTMKYIDIKYEYFKENIEQLKKSREELNKLTLKEMYYTTFQNDIKEILKKLEEYEKILDQIMNNHEFLNQSCELYYPDKTANDNCMSYKQNKEQLKETFKSDAKTINDQIQKYNDWIDENNFGYQKINLYESKYLD